MYHVGRLGSYITRGVYTVSGPFHPFGGAVDIIVVEQPDGSFKSSPWYVRFGKFQGVLKAREKEVSISVNGVDANFHMYLDQRGEAYFLRELAGEEGEFVSSSSSSSSSSDETGENSQKIRRPMKSKSCNYDVVKSTLDDQIDAANGEIMPRTRSRRSRIFGLVFGRRSMKEDSYKSADDVDGAGIARISSLERAEIAANLLDVKWSTNLAAIKPIKDNTSLSSASTASDGKGDKYKLTNDGKMQVDSSMQEAMDFCVENNILIEESGSCDVQMGNHSQSAFENQKFLIKETNVEISSLVTGEQIVETISEVSCSNTRIVDHSEAIPGNKFAEGLGADGIQSFICCRKTENSVMGLDKSKEESDETLYLTSGGPRDVHFCAETLHVTTELPSQDAVIQQAEEIELETVQIDYCDNYPQQKNSSPPVCGQDEVNLQVPLTLSESYAEKVSVDPTHNLVEVSSKNISSISGFNNSVHPTENEMIFGGKVNADELQPSRESVINGDCDMIKAASAPLSESSEEEQFPFSDIVDSKYRESQRVSDSLDDVDKKDHSSCSPKGTLKINNPLNTNDEPYSSLDCFFQKNQSSDTDNLIDNSNLASNPISIHANAGAEVGLFTGSLPNMWSQIDNFGAEDGPCPLSRSLDSNFMSLEWKTPSKEKECFINSTTGKENQLSPARSSKGNSHLSENIKSGVVNPVVEISLCRHLLHEGMGAVAASQAFDAEKLDIDKLTSLGPTIVTNDRLIVRIGGHYFPWDAAAPIVLGIAAFGREIIFEPKGMIPVDQVEKSLVGDPSKTIVTSGGSWGIWPFRRSRSRKTGQSTPIDTGSTDVENVSESNVILDNDKNMVKPKVSRKKIRANTPTSEELASLNLKEGSNVVTFTFSTAMLGRQKVDARIFLWKWNTRIVISDVDGTITKSDVLGQFMPLVGVDWSQTGVAHLFSAIKENGYQLLFLSARAISQAYITRQFLVNLKQDGKALPDGPVVISPDGLFPSLYREVIRRAPHEFKIACLEDIKALFPSDCNPFYAGFGNRDTDEFSYLKVGIPKGKIFTINPKGEVSVHGRHDTKSYSSLHALVHGMFPVMTSSEQEDFNSWNFWRLPTPLIDT